MGRAFIGTSITHACIRHCTRTIDPTLILSISALLAVARFVNFHIFGTVDVPACLWVAQMYSVQKDAADTRFRQILFS